jgi:hypothetical protein
MMAGILLATLIATLGIRKLVPAEAVAPAIVTLLFAAGAVTAGFALLCRRARFRIMCLDVAGGLTFIGIVVWGLIEPEQLPTVISGSQPPE